MFLAIASFLCVLGLLVLVHELGHFITARLFGIQVLEFGFGYPPRIFSVRHGETVYSLNLIPLGGFVKLRGEEDPSHPRSLARKGIGTRFIVLSAGSAMNVLLPILIFAILLMVPHSTMVNDVRILDVAAKSPAAASGLLPGDRIVSVDGRPADNVNTVRFLIQLNLGAQTPWVIERDGTRLQSNLIPRFRPPPNEGASGIRLADQRVSVTNVEVGSPGNRLGILPGDALLAIEGFPIVTGEAITQLLELARTQAQVDQADLLIWRSGQLETLKLPTAMDEVIAIYDGITLHDTPPTRTSLLIWQAIPQSVLHVWDILVLVKNEVSTWFLGSNSPQLIGPVGIAQITGQAAKSGALPLLELAALLSINLAIINMLPLPALDGGRVLFVALEWIRGGKRVSPKREGTVHIIGFVVLLLIIMIITYQDILRIFRGEVFL